MVILSHAVSQTVNNKYLAVALKTFVSCLNRKNKTRTNETEIDNGRLTLRRNLLK